jgi:tRNA-modifying protein YgfZ
VPVTFETTPSAGVEVRAGERPAGNIGSAANGKGLAMLRLDRVHEALSKGEKITAGGIEISLKKPDWARFMFPGEAGFGT